MESFMINVSVTETLTFNTLTVASMRANFTVMTPIMTDSVFIDSKFTFISFVQWKEIKIRELSEIIFPHSFLNLVIYLADSFFFANIFAQVIIITDVIIHNYLFPFMIVLKFRLIS